MGQICCFAFMLAAAVCNSSAGLLNLIASELENSDASGPLNSNSNGFDLSELKRMASQLGGAGGVHDQVGY